MPESPPTPFSGIFVSYRRDDSSGHAGRLFDKLVDHFGKDRIFMDIDTIEPGEDFVTVIENAVGSCEILIAIIGRQWLNSAGRNTGRLDNPHDFVRLEIATALERNIRVIPVLVQRASMPKPQDLPDDLAKFSRRNAVELTDLRWQTDVGQLIGFMESVLAKREVAARLAEAARQAEEERLRQEEEEKLRVEKEKKLRLEEEEAEQRAAEAERREAEERERSEAEERVRQAAEVSRQAEEERKRHAEEEKRRVEEEKQLRLAEEEAARVAAEEQRRNEEEIERRKQEEQEKLESQEASRRRAEQERVQAEAEERRRTEIEAKLRRVEAEETERRRIEEERRARAEQERIRREAEEAKRKHAAQQALQPSREERQTKPDPPAIADTPSSKPAGEVSNSRARFSGPTPLPGAGSKRTILLVIIASVAVVGLVASFVFVWISLTPTADQSANRNANIQLPTTTAPPTAAIQPPAGMVYVPGGEFMMGRDDGDEAERPAHGVTVKPFFIDTYEVTNENYQKFVKATGHATPPAWNNGLFPSGSGHHPVTGVTWDDANDYARWADKRLPTEQEWEFAARGKDGRMYPWGNDWRQGSANANGSGQSLVDVGGPVGPNNATSPFGAFDMVGNAWEWTASGFGAYRSGSRPSGKLKVIRGGSYESTKDYATTTYRAGWLARGARTYDQTGFRCVKDIAP